MTKDGGASWDSPVTASAGEPGHEHFSVLSLGIRTPIELEERLQPGVYANRTTLQ